MSPLMIGISAVGGLLLLAVLALVMIRKERRAHDNVQWPLRDGVRVLATITDVQIRQGWKVGERWERSPWDGHLVRQKTWQTSYDVTAVWMHAQTKQRTFFAARSGLTTLQRHLPWDRRLSSSSTFVILSALLQTRSPSLK